VGRAGETGLGGPVPLGTAGVSGEGVFRGKKAGSVGKHIAIVAAGAVQTLIGLAKTRDGSADTVRVESPPVGACFTNAIDPIAASWISWRRKV
jgi:hypothetical protein